MSKTAFTNDKDHAVHVGNVMIAPGQTRTVDVRDLPAYRPEPAEEAPADPIAQLLDQTVPDVAAALHDLTDEALDAVQAAEEAGDERKGVLEAIEAERLNRAREDE